MVTVCIVLYNNSRFIQDCFSTLIQASKKIDEIIFFDNDSQDDTLKKLEIIIKNQKSKNSIVNIKVIKNKENIGFTKAINTCIEKAGNKDILLLNPDSKLCSDSFENLFKFYSQNKPAIVGGKFTSYDNDDNINQQSAVASTSFLNCLLTLTNVGKLPFFRSLQNNFWEKNDELKEVIGVSGGYMLFSKQIDKKIDGFDEDFWMYLEDLDFCIRARNKGYKVYFIPTALIKHFGGGSSARLSNYRYNKKRWFRSRDIFFRKHFTPLHYAFFKLISIFEIAALSTREQYRNTMSQW